MKGLFLFCSLLLMATLTWAKDAPQRKPTLQPDQPELLVSNLYKQVVNLHPVGIPSGSAEKAFAPYLSKALRRRFDLNNACLLDWRKQYPNPNLKPPVGMIETGVFPGLAREQSHKLFRLREPNEEKAPLVYI